MPSARSAIRLWPLPDGEYAGQVIAPDGEPVLTLRSCKSLESAQALVEALRAMAREPGMFRMLDIGNTRFAFGIEDEDRKLMATSTIYGSAEARADAAHRVAPLLDGAPIVVMSGGGT